MGSNPTVGVSGVIWCPDHNLLNSKPGINLQSRWVVLHAGECQRLITIEY